MKVVGFSALCTGRLYSPGNICVTRFLLEAKSTAGIEVATFRLVAQYLNQLPRHVPPIHRHKNLRITASSREQTTHKSTPVLKMYSLLHVLYKLVFMGHNNPFNVIHPTPSQILQFYPQQKSLHMSDAAPHA
jgi:hypothetical protein